MSRFERLSYLISSVFGYFILTFVINGVIGGLLKNNQLDILQFLNKIVFLLICWFYIKYFHRKINLLSPGSYFKFRRIDILTFIIGAIIPITLTMLSIGVLCIIKIEIETIFLANKALLKEIVNGFITSLNEELLFRAFIFLSLVKIYGKVFLSALSTSVLFAVLHMGSISHDFFFLSLLNVLIGGLLLSYLYYISGSIWITIGFHTLNNFLARFIDFPQSSVMHTNELNLLIYTVLLFGLLVACMFFVKRKSDALPVSSEPK